MNDNRKILSREHAHEEFYCFEKKKNIEWNEKKKKMHVTSKLFDYLAKIQSLIQK